MTALRLIRVLNRLTKLAVKPEALPARSI